MNSGIKTGIVLLIALILLSNVTSATVYRWVPSDGQNIANGITTNWGTCGSKPNSYAITLLTTAGTSGCPLDTYHDSGPLNPAVDMFFNTAYTVDTNVQGNWYYGHLRDTSMLSIDIYTFRLIYANPDGTIGVLPGNGSVTIPNYGNVEADYNISLTGISGTVPAGAKLGLRISKSGNSQMRIYFGDTANTTGEPSGYFSVSETPLGDNIPPVITIISPVNTIYSTTSIFLDVSANEPISTWLYSLNGAPNETFTPSTTIPAVEGLNSIIVYGNDSSNNWNSSSVDFTVQLPKLDQIITFGTLVGKIYGDPAFDVTATASSGLTVSFSASGTCTISGSTVSITGAGSCTVTANQSGNATYNPATDVPRSFTINQATPIITWNNPADITYGTALGATQLNAIASVPGDFVYNPIAGTVLSAGAGQTLHVDFTPIDTTNYALASKNVVINVVSELPTVRYINGTVMDSLTHEVLVGVNVSTTGGIYSVTDSFGRYSLAVVSGSYPLTATYDIRYRTNSSVTVSTVLVAVVNQDIELELKPVGIITGTVRHTEKTTW